MNYDNAKQFNIHLRVSIDDFILLYASSQRLTTIEIENEIKTKMKTH